MSAQRFTALDVFRGMTVCFMIIVNNQAGPAFTPLHHAAWDGFTPTDLVFPSFLFAVGNAMAFTMPKWTGLPASGVVTKILKRTILIFLIGYLLSWFPFVAQDASGVWSLKPIENTRIFGVLQRIALCYGIAALLIQFLSARKVVIASLILLLGYWAVLLLNGDLTMLGNAGIAVDKWLVGENHMYKGEGVPFDPEGFLSTFPAVVNVIIGYFAGVLLRDKGKDYESIAKVLLAGVVLMAIAYCWNYSFPINKKLWTSSYVLHTSGISLLMIGLLVYVIDKSSLSKSWNYFFEVFGKNPLFIYVLSGVIPRLFSMIKTGEDKTLGELITQDIFQQYIPGEWGTLLYAVSLTMVCWLVGYWMDKKKVYVRV
jgi:predicted acyltransferase